MIHLRVIAPPRLTPPIIELLERTDGVTHVVMAQDAGVRPRGDLVECDVSREVVNDLCERLEDLGVTQAGGITVTELEGVLGDAAAAAVRSVRGTESDALVWEELVARVRLDAELSIGFLVLMGCAAVIAVVAIVTDNPVLVVGAMIVSPDFGPVAGVAVGLVGRNRQDLATSTGTLVLGFGTAMVVALLCGVLANVAGRIPASYEVFGAGPLTDFISDPNLASLMVALVAGVAGAVFLARAHSGAVIGVFVSITTIPAAANVGLASAVGRWSEAGGAALQLAVNVVGLVSAFALTLMAARRLAHLPLMRKRIRVGDVGRPPSIGG